MTDQLIPFGKYKGKPVEILAEDKDYTNWLLAQPWFKTKYQNIHMIVINNFHAPVDTPEHNELQVKFLDKKYALKLAYLLEPRLFDKGHLPTISNLTVEKGYDVSYMASTPHWYASAKILIEIKPTIADDFPSVLRQMKASMPITCGDFDDPRKKFYYCLVVRDYIGVGADREQFIQFFQSQGYRVIFWTDIENTKLPETK
jgi:hypothetical protein